MSCAAGQHLSSVLEEPEFIKTLACVQQFGRSSSVYMHSIHLNLLSPGSLRASSLMRDGSHVSACSAEMHASRLGVGSAETSSFTSSADAFWICLANFLIRGT